MANLAKIGNPDPWLLLSTYMTDAQGVDAMIGPGVPPNTDDRPYLEYVVLRAGPLQPQDMIDNLRMISAGSQSVATRVQPSDRTERTLARLARGRSLMDRLLEVRIVHLAGRDAEARSSMISVIQDFGMDEAAVKLYEPFYKW